VGPKKMGPFVVPRTMASTVSATLAVPFKIKGVNYSISSACATSAHCIGNGMELIQSGKQKIIFAGGGEEIHWAMSAMFDAMTALSSKYNETPETASRPYDKSRDGFVIAGGAGVIVLEELEHAKARGAKIYAELTGYGATSDGYDMVAPSGEGAVRCMKMSLKTARNKIDYINTHGTSTPVGDITELRAVKEAFGDSIPKISSTKSLTGHPLGAASVHEAIYCLIMMKNNFIAASANITEMDDEAKNFPIVTKVEKNVTLNSVMSNSFGFGGTNATLIFEKI
jgi:3-oxoacyl-[acyl-carrier-protein] synthase-1